MVKRVCKSMSDNTRKRIIQVLDNTGFTVFNLDPPPKIITVLYMYVYHSMSNFEMGQTSEIHSFTSCI